MMPELFPALLEEAQRAVEDCLDGNVYNPISAITGETFRIVEGLSAEEISRLLAERPGIMENEVRLQDPPPRSVRLADIAREAVAMELQQNIEMAPFAAALAEWREYARIPVHLSDGVERALRGVQSARP